MDRKISSDTSEVNSISSMLFRLLFAFDNIHFPLPHELSILWKVSGRKFDKSSRVTVFLQSVKRFSVKKAINYVRSIGETFVNAQIAMIDMTSIISVAINSKCSYFVIQQKIVGLIAQTTTPFPNSVKSNRFPNRFFQTKTQYHAKDKTVELTTKKEWFPFLCEVQ